MFIIICDFGCIRVVLVNLFCIENFIVIITIGKSIKSPINMHVVSLFCILF